jgi:plastocyanin
MVLLAACSSLPRATQTGTVHEVVIARSLSPAEATVGAGDEVRWVNQRPGEVQLVFLDSIEGQVACQRGFGLMGVANAATLSSDRSVSLCFSEPGVVRYIVRMDRTLPTGGLHIRGKILIEKRPLSN